MSTITIPDLSLVIEAKAAKPLKSNYRYTPLPLRGWTRVLVLHSGAFDDDLSCDLQHRRIDDAAGSGYEAVSYVWGSSEGHAMPVEVECDGQVIRIGESLACALRHIRHEGDTKYLWVDGVCINQEDVEDRSSQVSRWLRMPNCYG